MPTPANRPAPAGASNPETSKHTPGPWIARKGSAKAECSRTVSTSSRTQVAFVHGASSDEADANARLIAAAPELLVACEAIVHATKMNDPALGAVAATLARAAIAKAEGGAL